MVHYIFLLIKLVKLQSTAITVAFVGMEIISLCNRTDILTPFRKGTVCVPEPIKNREAVLVV